MSTTSWTRKLAFLAIIWTVSLIVLLGLAEMVLRLSASDWDEAELINVVRDRTYEFDAGHLYPTSNPTIVYHRNEWGLRDDCKSPADIDILTVGGSTTDERFLALKDTFQEVMERDLSRAAGRPICVSNAGVTGHSSYGHVVSFRSWFPLIPHLKPKIFLFYIGINDANVADLGPSFHDERQGFKRWKIYRLGEWAKSVVLSAYRRSTDDMGWPFDPAEYTQAAIKPETATLSQTNAEHFRARLRTMLAEAAKYDAAVICVTQPTRWVTVKDGRRYGLKYGELENPLRFDGLDFDYSQQAVNRVMLEECGKDRLLDLYSRNYPPSIFYDAMHTNPTGSREIGMAMAEWIEHSDLMPLLSGDKARNGH